LLSGTKALIVDIIGNSLMTADEVHATLLVMGRLPRSADPRGYIGYLLASSSNPKEEARLFDREPGLRGYYRNHKPPRKRAPKKTPKAKVRPTAWTKVLKGFPGDDES
jgi:hypothetical protein